MTTNISISRGGNKWIWDQPIISTPSSNHLIFIDGVSYTICDGAMEEFLQRTAYYVKPLADFEYLNDPMKSIDDLKLLADIAIMWSKGEREIITDDDGGRKYRYKKP